MKRWDEDEASASCQPGASAGGFTTGNSARSQKMKQGDLRAPKPHRKQGETEVHALWLNLSLCLSLKE